MTKTETFAYADLIAIADVFEHSSLFRVYRLMVLLFKFCCKKLGGVEFKPKGFNDAKIMHLFIFVRRASIF